MDIDTTNFLAIAIIAGGVTGGALGLFPLIVGWLLGYRKIGFIGLGCTFVAGMILGMIAGIPVSLGFTVYIANEVKKERKSKVDAYPY